VLSDQKFSLMTLPAGSSGRLSAYKAFARGGRQEIEVPYSLRYAE